MDKISKWLEGIHPDISLVQSIDSGYQSYQSFETPTSVPTMSSVTSQYSSSPNTSPAQVLNELENFDPSIRTIPQKLPPAAMYLRSRISSNFGTAVIPTELQKFIENNAPIEALDIPPQAFNAIAEVSVMETLGKWEFVTEINRGCK